MFFRILRMRLREAFEALIGHGESCGRCQLCNKSFYWNPGFWVPFGNDGAIIAFCTPCFKKETTRRLVLALRLACLQVGYYIACQDDTSMLSDAIRAVEYLKGDMSGEPPFKNPWFKDFRTLGEFPDDPIAQANHLKTTTASV